LLRRMAALSLHTKIKPESRVRGVFLLAFRRYQQYLTTSMVQGIVIALSVELPVRPIVNIVAACGMKELSRSRLYAIHMGEIFEGFIELLKNTPRGGNRSRHT